MDHLNTRPVRLRISSFLPILTWVIFWLFPWQPWLKDFIWARVGLSLVAFILPGAWLFELLDDSDTNCLERIPHGFAISLVIIALLGLIARWGHFSMEIIALCFWVSGSILVLMVTLKRLGNRGLRSLKPGGLSKLLDLWPIPVMTVLLGLVTIQRIITDDDLIYLAYQTYFEKAALLDFKEIIFGYDQLSSARFWIVSISFGQALLSKIGDLSAALLSAGYYEPFLVALSAIAFCRLARTLGLSRRMGALSVVFQFAFMVLLSEYLHAGAPFLSQLGTDKATAAFILAPVFLDSIHRLFHNPSPSNITISLIAALSLSFAHPVIFGLAGFIAGFAGLLGTDQMNFSKRILIPGIILLVALLPQAAVRLSGHPSSELYGQGQYRILHGETIDRRIRLWDDTRFYGFDPSLLAIHIPYEERLHLIAPIFVHYGWLLIPLTAGLMALRKVRQEATARYILAALVLVILALVPFTGWIIGALTTPGMLERSVWLFPFGITATYLLTILKWAVFQKTPAGRTRFREAFSNAAAAVLLMACAGIVLLYMRETGIPDFDQLHRRTIRYEGLSEIGLFIDQAHQGNVRIAGSEKINDFIPIFSIEGKLISYRPSVRSYSYFIPLQEHTLRVQDRQTIFASDATPERKLEICRKYQINYLLLRTEELGQIQSLLSRYPDIFEREIQTGSYTLIAVH